MSRKLYAALEAATDIDFSSGHPLGYVIDLNAVDSLYAAYDETSPGDPPVLRFQYEGYEITIVDDQEIRIVPV